MLLCKTCHDRDSSVGSHETHMSHNCCRHSSVHGHRGEFDLVQASKWNVAVWNSNVASNRFRKITHLLTYTIAQSGFSTAIWKIQVLNWMNADVGCTVLLFHLMTCLITLAVNFLTMSFWNIVRWLFCLWPSTPMTFKKWTNITASLIKLSWFEGCHLGLVTSFSDQIVEPILLGNVSIVYVVYCITMTSYVI